MHDNDHSSVNTVHNITTSVQSETSFTRDTININVSNSHDTFNEKLLKFASLNVCGLKRKVLFPEFGNLVNNYQVFSVCETKLDRYDLIELPGYVFLSQCGKQKYIRKSGGIGVFVKQSFSHISQIESDSDYVLCFSISKEVFNTYQNIYVGAVYIPLNESRFYNPDEIEKFNVEITNMTISNKYVLLTNGLITKNHCPDVFISSTSSIENE